MKKLLCMIISIVLLLSLVPVNTFADAAPTVEFLPEEYIIKANVVDETGAAAVSSADGSFTVESDGWVSTEATLDCGELGTTRVLETTATVATVNFHFDLPEGKYIPYFWNAIADTSSTTDTLFEVVMGDTTVASAKRSQTSGGTGGTGWKPIYIKAGTNGNQNIPAEALSLSGKVSLRVSSAGNKKSRIIAVKLVRQADEYFIIRNTVRGSTGTTEGTFELGNVSNWGDSNLSFSCNNETAVKQVYTRTVDEYAQFNFVSGPVTSVNVMGSAAYDGIDAGYYNVFFYDPYGANTGDAAAVNATVYHNGETATTTVDTTGDAGWYKIFEKVYFSGSGDEYVRFTATDTKYMRMGAVKLEKCFTAEPTEEVKPLVSGLSYADGKFSITTNGASIEGSDPVTLKMIVAKYEKNEEQLVSVISDSVTINPVNEDIVKSIPLTAAANYRYKLFVIDSMSTLKPIVESVEF